MLTPTIAYFFTSPTGDGSTGAAPAIDTNGDLFFQAKTEIIELPNKGTVAHPSYGSPVQLNYDPSYNHGPLSGIYPDFPSAAMGSSTAVDDGIGASGNAITHTPPGASNSDRTLYSFPDGTQLGGLLIDGANNIWGTTYTSSSSLGMIFELSNPNPALDTSNVYNMTYQDAVYYFANHGTLISSMADDVLGQFPQYYSSTIYHDIHPSLPYSPPSPHSLRPLPPRTISVMDTTTSNPLLPSVEVYNGPVAGLEQQYVSTGVDSLNITALSPDWFIHSGNGDDAIAVNVGTNVLDGGTGSNFLTGGSGTDTFFVDDRNASADIWSTVNNFHAGDAATIFMACSTTVGLLHPTTHPERAICPANQP